jgi:glycosyltransferase involved in cell wall biosynthesis
MRIALLAWRDLAHPNAGGSEYVVDRLALGLQARGHSVTLFAGGPVERRAYEVVDTGGRFSQYLLAPSRVMRRDPDADVVVDVENGIPFFSPLWRRRPVVCLVLHVHVEQWDLYFPKPVALLGETLEKVAMPWVYRAAQFVAISPSTADALAALGVERRRIHTVTMGTEPAAPVTSEDPAPLFLSLSRLVPHKRVDLLLELWDEVRPRTGGTLVIAGDGPERARLERAAGAGVLFTGFITEAEKQALLARAWMLVHPALHEGWGIVVMEAAAVGTPTVGFDVVGVRDSVHHGRTGLLADSNRAFVQHWVDLATDTARRAELGRGARAWAQEQSWDRAVDQFLDVLELAVARPPTRLRHLGSYNDVE